MDILQDQNDRRPLLHKHIKLKSTRVAGLRSAEPDKAPCWLGVRKSRVKDVIDKWEVPD